MPSSSSSRRGATPRAARTPLRPSLGLLVTEPWRAAGEFLARLRMAAPAEATGDGHPVIIFPGLATDGFAVRPLRDHCRSLGYDAHDWGRGRNVGPDGALDGWLDDLARHVDTLTLGHRQPATLIGWSLGGLYARELGKLMPGRVRQVITIGTPFNAGASQTHAGWLYRLLNGSTVPDDRAIRHRLRTPPPQPTTSIYSRSDGVVPWQACRHDAASRRRVGEPVEDVEVHGSHVGMGWNPAVLSIVAERLASTPPDTPADQGPARAAVRAMARTPWGAGPLAA